MGKQDATEQLPCGCLTGTGTTRQTLLEPCKDIRSQYTEAQELIRKGMGLTATERQRLGTIQEQLRKHMAQERRRR